jgi:dipeptidyl aminopeptidase/acylaminoacyl peptidase
MGLKTSSFTLPAMLALALPAPAGATQPLALTAADYARAERLAGYKANPLVDHAIVNVTWLDPTHFWFRDHDARGDRFLQVDATTGKASPSFDAGKLAAALAHASGKPVDANKLPLTDYRVVDDGGFDVTVDKVHYRCDAAFKVCTAVAHAGGKEPGVLSPDKRSEAFVRDWNLWLRDVATGRETPLTRDGVADFGYATDNAGWIHSDRAVLVWSPDSTRIATFQQDQRKTGSMTLVGTNVGHPHVETWKYPLVGDKDVTMIERVVIDVPGARVLRLKTPPDQHRSTLCDDVSCEGGWEDVQWAPDGRTLAFVSSTRDHKQAWLRVADVATGAVRDVLHESVPTYFESGNGAVNWRYLPQSNEVLVVQRAQRLGKPLSLRPGQRQAQACGDDRQRQRHRSRARGCGIAIVVVPGRRSRASGRRPRGAIRISRRSTRCRSTEGRRRC